MDVHNGICHGGLNGNLRLRGVQAQGRRHIRLSDGNRLFKGFIGIRLDRHGILPVRQHRLVPILIGLSIDDNLGARGIQGKFDRARLLRHIGERQLLFLAAGNKDLTGVNGNGVLCHHDGIETFQKGDGLHVLGDGCGDRRTGCGRSLQLRTGI